MSLLDTDGRSTGIVLSIGSNLGEREWNVLAGSAALEAVRGIYGCRLSSLYLSDPVGSGYSRSFVNAVMIAGAAIGPFELLRSCQEIERGAGREPGGGDRILDIDIVIFGREVISTPELEIPHPEFRGRLFVLLPLAELEPDLDLPPDGRTAREAAAMLEGSQSISRISSRKIGGGGLPALRY